MRFPHSTIFWASKALGFPGIWSRYLSWCIPGHLSQLALSEFSCSRICWCRSPGSYNNNNNSLHLYSAFMGIQRALRLFLCLIELVVLFLHYIVVYWYCDFNEQTNLVLLVISPFRLELRSQARLASLSTNGSFRYLKNLPWTAFSFTHLIQSRSIFSLSTRPSSENSCSAFHPWF